MNNPMNGHHRWIKMMANCVGCWWRTRVDVCRSHTSHINNRIKFSYGKSTALISTATTHYWYSYAVQFRVRYQGTLHHPWKQYRNCSYRTVSAAWVFLCSKGCEVLHGVTLHNSCMLTTHPDDEKSSLKRSALFRTRFVFIQATKLQPKLWRTPNEKLPFRRSDGATRMLWQRALWIIEES